ncbi:hypothetical protein G6F35_016855 [Rhizopus arrhizus]|nr:hypothetical protein G6F35_016855 [Rhizopus arrhizus]
MPGGKYGDGAALLGFLRRRFSGIPLVVLTGVGGIQVLASIRKAGVACIVAKADPISELASAIRAARNGEGYLSADVERQLASQPASGEARLTKREAEPADHQHAEALRHAQAGHAAPGGDLRVRRADRHGVSLAGNACASGRER